LVGTRVDFKQKVAFVDVSTLNEIDLEQLARNLRLYLHGDGGFDAADRVEFDGRSFLAGVRDANRDRGRGAGGLHLRRAARGGKGGAGERQAANRVSVVRRARAAAVGPVQIINERPFTLSPRRAETVYLHSDV